MYVHLHTYPVKILIPFHPIPSPSQSIPSHSIPEYTT